MRNPVSRNSRLLLAAAVLVASGLVGGRLAGVAQAQPATTMPATTTLAATTDAPAGQQTARIKDTCADSRDWVEAEAGYPGSLLDMAKQSLAECETRQQAAK